MNTYLMNMTSTADIRTVTRWDFFHSVPKQTSLVQGFHCLGAFCRRLNFIAVIATQRRCSDNLALLAEMRQGRKHNTDYALLQLLPSNRHHSKRRFAYMIYVAKTHTQYVHAYIHTCMLRLND